MKCAICRNGFTVKGHITVVLEEIKPPLYLKTSRPKSAKTVVKNIYLKKQTVNFWGKPRKRPIEESIWSFCDLQLNR